MFNSPFIIPVVAIICWALVSIFGKDNDSNKAAWDKDGKKVPTPPMFKKILEKEMAERDGEILKLKERVQVLETIITDTHKSHKLSEEIENLK